MIIRDAVWGDIELPEWAEGLLDTAEMQRLRRVRQLGFAYLVYPGAQHSRFEHSLGTAHVAGVILQSLGLSQDEWAPAALAAALLHDVAHAPFGHTFEDERPLFSRHDAPERMLAALGGELGQRLSRLSFGRNAQAILLRSAGVPHWAQDVVAGAIDADLLDYLRRDAYFTGLRVNYDERVLRTLSVIEGRLGVVLTRHGRVRLDARSEVLQLFRLRYLLTERVYLHHTKVAAGAMLAKAVENAVAHGLALQEVLGGTDDALLDLLAAGTYGADAQVLARRLLERRLLKRALVAEWREVGEETLQRLYAHLLEPMRRRRAEAEIAAAVGVPASLVAIACPPAPEFREMRVRTELPGGAFPLDAPPGGDAEVALLMQRYRELWQLAVFAPAEVRTKAGEAARSLLQLAP